MAVDGAVDVSATVVVHVDLDHLGQHGDDRRQKFVHALVTRLLDEASDRLGAGCSPTGSDVNDNGGAHVHGAVNDEVDVKRAAFNRSKPQL